MASTTKETDLWKQIFKDQKKTKGLYLLTFFNLHFLIECLALPLFF
jgi:hypothetical protein